MCGPAAIGVAQFAVGAMSAVAQHKEAQAAAARQNAINQQNHQNQLRIARRQDDINKQKYDAELAAQAEAVTEYNKQTQLNQLEANRAASVVQKQKQEREAELAFETQTNMAQAIEAQGAMLSTGNVGQSFLLQTMQAERDLGFKHAQVQESLYNSNIVAAMENQGVHLKQFGADSAAFNKIGAGPVAERASFIPYEPIKVQGPSKGALMGAMIGAAAGGAATGISTYGSMVESGLYTPSSTVDGKKVASSYNF